jgi:hypothetical protein
MWRAFLNCRMFANWRYVRELVALERPWPLAFGSLTHGGLELWHQHRDLTAVRSYIDSACPNRASDDTQRRAWHLATSMLSGYAARYPTEEFEVVALEKEFEGEIVNPESGAASRSFTLAGKVDGIVRIGDQYFLLEHKTAAVIDGSYLDRLWTDFQITIYAHYVEQALGIPIAGVIYNILVKAKLQQGLGETEAEFEARRADLIARSKTGKSSAKRRMPESDEEFQARLAAKYAEPGMFHREQLFISRDQIDTLRAELWELTQAFLDARRRDVWYQNTSHCFAYGRPCPYFALCRSGGNPNVLENFYQHAAPHEELGSGEAAAVVETPVF